MRNVLVILVTMTIFATPGFCQKEKQKVLTDNNKKYVYTEEDGMTTSYINFFGSSYTFPELTAIDGQHLDSQLYKGKTVLFNFWFIACKPCVAEIPALNRIQKKYQSDSTLFVGITFDDTVKIKKFLENTAFTFRIARLDQDITPKFNKIGFYPCTMIINKHGMISYVIFGAPEGKKHLEKIYELLDHKLEKIIKE